MEVIVYADVLFALNFLMDLVMVFLTRLVTKQPVSVCRLTVAALILAVYGTLVVFPNMELCFSLSGRVILSFLALRCLGRKQWIKTVMVFWLISVALGGAVFGLTMQTAVGRTLRAVMVNGSLYLDVGIGELSLGILGAYALIWGFCRLAVRKFARERILIPFALTVGGKRLEVTALLDTGCELTVPGTGDAMMLISRKSLEGAYPAEVFRVPMQTAGGETSIWACYPETLTCQDANYEIVGIPAIGIVDEVFAEDNLYTAVLNPEMLTENGGENNETKKDCFYQALAEGGWLAAAPSKSLLHRRKRKSSSAAQPGGGSGVASKTGPTPEPAGSPANLD